MSNVVHEVKARSPHKGEDGKRGWWIETWCDSDRVFMPADGGGIEGDPTITCQACIAAKAAEAG